MSEPKSLEELRNEYYEAETTANVAAFKVAAAREAFDKAEEARQRAQAALNTAMERELGR